MLIRQSGYRIRRHAGMSVGRILNECNLTARIVKILARAARRRARARSPGSSTNGAARRAGICLGSRVTNRASFRPTSIVDGWPRFATGPILFDDGWPRFELIPSFLTTYLWPIGLVVVLASLWAGIDAASFSAGVSTLVMATIAAAGFILLAALVVYLRFAARRRSRLAR